MTIGLALSGGGFRAAAFHVGVLKRLEELDLLCKVQIVSTVSGGSFTGALYALYCGAVIGSRPVEPFVDVLKTMLSKNLRGAAFMGNGFRIARTLRSLLPMIGPSTRSSLLTDQIDRVFFKQARVANLPAWIVINATSLQSGKCWKFFHDKMGDYLVGAMPTGDISVAQAVCASAAYPGVFEPMVLDTDWSQVSLSQLDVRWGNFPAQERWRQRYGKARGKARFLLVDGGVYDNEGLQSLISYGVSHALLSTVAPPETDHRNRSKDLLRTIEVMHARLGAATRKLAWEMTHGEHPDQVREELLSLAQSLEGSSDLDLRAQANRVRELAAVGTPGRQHQFRAVAHVMVRTGSGPDCLDPELVHELSHVRTDLDALEEEVFELLMAHAYLTCDDLLKNWLQADEPKWSRAHAAITRANQNRAHYLTLLRASALRKLPAGRGPWWKSD